MFKSAALFKNRYLITTKFCIIRDLRDKYTRAVASKSRKPSLEVCWIFHEIFSQVYNFLRMLGFRKGLHFEERLTVIIYEIAPENFKLPPADIE